MTITDSPMTIKRSWDRVRSRVFFPYTPDPRRPAMRTTFVAACLLALVAFAAAHTYADSDELCLTPDVDEHDDEMVQAIIERFKANVCPKIPEGLLPACGGAVRSSVAPFTIPLAWNILYDPETGLGSNITDEYVAVARLRWLSHALSVFAGRLPSRLTS